MSILLQVGEVSSLALESLASGEDDFTERLKEAWLFHLHQLSPCDANLDVADDLDWVLSFCKRWEKEGCGSVDETDRIMITNRLIRLVVTTAREATGPRHPRRSSHFTSLRLRLSYVKWLACR